MGVAVISLDPSQKDERGAEIVCRAWFLSKRVQCRVELGGKPDGVCVGVGCDAGKMSCVSMEEQALM